MKRFLKILGGNGESLAEIFLEKNGYRILEKNYRTPFGELDIIALEGDAIAFIEVKTRRTNTCGNPLDSITAKKKTNLTKSALFYLGQKKYQFSIYRFDAVSIEMNNGCKTNIEIIKNAFETDSDYSL